MLNFRSPSFAALHPSRASGRSPPSALRQVARAQSCITFLMQFYKISLYFTKSSPPGPSHLHNPSLPNRFRQSIWPHCPDIAVHMDMMPRCLDAPLFTAVSLQDDKTIHAPLWIHYIHPLEHIGTWLNAEEASTWSSSSTCNTASGIRTLFKINVQFEFLKNSSSLPGP